MPIDKKEKEREHLGREICLSEIVWFNLGSQYTYCNADLRPHFYIVFGKQSLGD